MMLKLNSLHVFLTCKEKFGKMQKQSCDTMIHYFIVNDSYFAFPLNRNQILLLENMEFI